MARRITQAYLKNRFALVAEARGWKDQGATTINSVYLERAFGGRWRIVRIVNSNGGQRTISDTYSTREMLAYLDALTDAANGRHVPTCQPNT